MNSNGNNDLLRSALQRRASRMAPTNGWEERVLAETTQPRRRLRLKWLTVPAAAAAAIVIALTLPRRAEQAAPIGVDLLIAEAPQPLAIEKPALPHRPESPRRPAPPRVAPAEIPDIDYEFRGIEVDEELTVMEEIEALIYAYNIDAQ